MKVGAPPRQQRKMLRSECLELLARTSRGHVALSDRALPIIVPVNYRLVRDAIEIEATGRILTSAGAKGHIVCFEADSSGADEGWTVVVIGKLMGRRVRNSIPHCVWSRR